MCITLKKAYEEFSILISTPIFGDFLQRILKGMHLDCDAGLHLDVWIVMGRLHGILKGILQMLILLIIFMNFT